MSRLSKLLAAAFVGLIALGPGAAFSWATTIEDLIRLKSGKVPVSDDVLIALIESDGSVFHLTPDDLKPLKEKGFSDKLIIAMLLTSARARQTLIPLDPPVVNQPAVMPGQPTRYVQPSVEDGLPPPQQEPQPPVIVNVTQQVTVEQAPQQQPYYNPGYYAYPAYPVYSVAPVVHRPIEPIYWGYGGQRRPDTWAPTRGEVIGQIPRPAVEVPVIRNPVIRR